RLLEGIVQPVGIIAFPSPLDAGPHVEFIKDMRRTGPAGIGVEEAEVDVEIGAGLEFQIDPSHEIFGFAEHLAATLDPTALIEPCPLGADRCIVPQRKIYRADQVDPIHVGYGRSGIPLGHTRIGLLGEDTDRTARGVAAEECSLRASQHLHALDIEHPQNRAAGPGNIYAVHIEANAALPGCAATARNAADRE